MGEEITRPGARDISRDISRDEWEKKSLGQAREIFAEILAEISAEIVIFTRSGGGPSKAMPRGRGWGSTDWLTHSLTDPVSLYPAVGVGGARTDWLTL